ncbi:MAG: hypothetical protein NUV77_06455, partial [Thermoguttaceae bacterium]|nr:hypothetical protein [Thermoguttaceae bacterium]
LGLLQPFLPRVEQLARFLDSAFAREKFGRGLAGLLANSPEFVLQRGPALVRLGPLPAGLLLGGLPHRLDLRPIALELGAGTLDLVGFGAQARGRGLQLVGATEQIRLGFRALLFP